MPELGSKQNRLSTRKRKNMLLKALEKTLGVVAPACRAVGVQRSVYYEWINNDPKFREKVNEICEGAVDFVESKLFQTINEDRRGAVTAMIFFLRSRGKHRGYVERTEFTQVDKQGNAVTVDREHALEILKEGLNSLNGNFDDEQD